MVFAIGMTAVVEAQFTAGSCAPVTMALGARSSVTYTVGTAAGKDVVEFKVSLTGATDEYAALGFTDKATSNMKAISPVACSDGVIQAFATTAGGGKPTTQLADDTTTVSGTLSAGVLVCVFLRTIYDTAPMGAMTYSLVFGSPVTFAYVSGMGSVGGTWSMHSISGRVDATIAKCAAAATTDAPAAVTDAPAGMVTDAPMAAAVTDAPTGMVTDAPAGMVTDAPMAAAVTDAPAGPVVPPPPASGFTAGSCAPVTMALGARSSVTYTVGTAAGKDVVEFKVSLTGATDEYAALGFTDKATSNMKAISPVACSDGVIQAFATTAGGGKPTTQLADDTTTVSGTLSAGVLVCVFLRTIYDTAPMGAMTYSLVFGSPVTFAYVSGMGSVGGTWSMHSISGRVDATIAKCAAAATTDAPAGMVTDAPTAAVTDAPTLAPGDTMVPAASTDAPGAAVTDAPTLAPGSTMIPATDAPIAAAVTDAPTLAPGATMVPATDVPTLAPGSTMTLPLMHQSLLP